jgi:isoamylase
VKWCEAVFSHSFIEPEGARNDLDSARYMPRCVVIDPGFDWGDDRPPRTPWDITFIYELHVRGFTRTHPDVPAELRGTYLGLVHPSVIFYFKTLGVTAIEFMPVQHFVQDMHLLERGLNNYWGYNTIGFFAPHNRYSNGCHQTAREIQDFRTMVKGLHEAGLEVILDVAYGHTAEGNHLGPMLSFKGIDNQVYYRLDENNPFYYRDYTGTGNSLNVRHPNVLQLMMDSLRYWVTEMHVDGFRFDLASTLARGCHDVDRLSAFFNVIQQDPVISQVKLIAEPWDVGDGGYQLGKFPPLWSEWNGRFRDSVRDYWRGCDHMLSDFSLRISGSPDLYQFERRGPSASINFITCHDGFTLADLVTYNDKHNGANCQWESSGENHNRSWNCGVEGETDDEAINKLRQRQKRNLLATLMLSQGVPMMLGGDELGRTQGGNNNAYCQDNEISWVDWEHADHDLIAFVKELAALRREHSVFRMQQFAFGEVGWYRNDGKPMTAADWCTPWAKAVGMFLSGSNLDQRDNDFYVALNSHSQPIQFTIPRELGHQWRVVVHTCEHQTEPTAGCPNSTVLCVEAHSLLIVVRVNCPAST